MTQYLSTEDLNLDYVGYRPAILYINGKYWGIYNIREKVREDYITDNHNIDKSMFDFVQNGWLEIINGIPRYEPEQTINITQASKVEAFFDEVTINEMPNSYSESATLTKDKSPYYALHNVVIDTGVILTVEPGVIIYMNDYKSIIVHGGLRLDGVEEDSIYIKPTPQSKANEWGALCIDKATNSTILNYVNITGASWYEDQERFKATITSKNSSVKIRNSKVSSAFFPFYSEYSKVDITSSVFESSKTCDFINIKYTDSASVEGCYFLGNDYPDVDAIDFDGVIDGRILGNYFTGYNGFNSDAIDIGESSSNIVIEGNKIFNISDKGVSVGQGSSVIIKRNLIYGCNMGVGIKDSNSYAFIENNLFAIVNYGVDVFEKNTNSGGGTAEIINCLFYNCIEYPVFKDNKSHVTVSNSFSNTKELAG